jgi:hypothetical protein
MRKVQIPIVSDLLLARWPQWREALKELLVVLLFSLMPLWLGLLIVGLLSLPDSTGGFLGRFASSSDLGIISASLLGPLLYVILRDQGPMSGDRISTQFPSALWFVLFIFLCCLVTTTMYSFNYLSGLNWIFDATGHPIRFVDAAFVSGMSVVVFVFSIFLVLSVAVIRNTITSGAPGIMSEETESLANQLQRQTENEADNLAEGLKKQGGGES